MSHGRKTLPLAPIAAADMLDLAKHIVNQKTADFEPDKFEDHYEEAFTELINAKRNGQTISAKPRPRADNVVNLMDALKKSIASESPKAKKPRKASAGRKRCFCQLRGRSLRQKGPPNPNVLLGAVGRVSQNTPSVVTIWADRGTP
jgi:DNA end-binding protein Ku